ncbi:MAG: YncE family protein [Gammaproteobacteria bacterium]|nr:YncE family protein [Gammaproteobacteria bacterium]
MAVTDVQHWSLACFQDYGDRGSVALIHCRDGQFTVQKMAQTAASGLSHEKRPVYLSSTDSGEAIMMDAVSKKISLSLHVPEDAFGIYYYPDTEQNVMWCTIDGDKNNGADPLNCSDGGASVIAMRGEGNETSLLKLICLGRGHHVVTAVNHPQLPKKVFVSSLLDGILSVIDNDPTSDNYLNIIETINLCQPNREKDSATDVPNNAFPHGMAFSPLTRKIYCLNNGYANINVVDPVTHEVEALIDMELSSNLLLSPCGRYLIGKGADRKSNPDHVIGRLCVLDAQTQKMETVLDLQDIYPSCYRFTPDGKKLYVTTAATGKGTQKDNLIYDTLYIYDSSALPVLTLLKEVKVGQADCGRRSIAFLKHNKQTPYVFVPNPSEGTVSILDGNTDDVLDTVSVGQTGAQETAFNYWDGRFYGA